MKNGWPYVYRTRLQLIPGHELDNPWQEGLPDNVSLIPKLEYFRQVAYRIVRNAAGDEARNSVEALAFDLEKLTPTIIAKYDLEPVLQAYYKTLVAYTDGIATKIRKGEHAVNGIYRYEDLRNPEDSSKDGEWRDNPNLQKPLEQRLQEELAMPMQEAIGAVDSELAGLKAKVAMQAQMYSADPKKAAQALNLDTHVVGGKQIEQVPLPSLEGVKGAYAEARRIIAKIAEDKKEHFTVLDGLCKDASFQRKYDELKEAESAIYVRIRTKLIALGEKAGDDKDLFGILAAISKRSKGRQEIERRYKCYMLSMFAMVMLLAVVACLLHYAYEKHIKPLHFGFMIAATAISVVLLAIKGVREYQQIQADAKAEAHNRPAEVKPVYTGSSYYMFEQVEERLLLPHE